MEIRLSEEEIKELQNEFEGCNQQIKKLREAIDNLTTRAVEVQGILKLVARKKQNTPSETQIVENE